MIRTHVNKNIALPLLLAFALFFTNFNFIAYGIDSSYESNYFFKETNNGFILRYEQVENNRTIYYDEEVKGNIINTKKYNKDNGDLKLLEEFNTIIDHENNGTTVATIENITLNTVETRVIGTETISNVRADASTSGRVYHPLHSDYYRSMATSGHLGLTNLTKAAITFAIGTVITGGTLVAGSVAGIVTGVMSGGWSNLYYRNESYAPEGKGPGRPLWRRIVRYYYDRDQTNQAGGNLYYDADILTKI